MRQDNRVRALAAERQDLWVAEGLLNGTAISLLLWAVLLLMLH